MSDILISYVVTVYNKEPYVGYTTDSLLQQEGNIPCEYIFVDDVSTDRSLEVIEARTKGRDNVTIVKNSVNGGPSVRLNQGAKLARGKYLQFIDSDDILAANASALMLSIIERYQADVVHGLWKKTQTPSAELLGTRVNEDAPYIVSDAPLKFIFEQRIRRMSQMAKRDTFLAAGGCDEGVFIQDESLGARLANVSQRFVLLKAPILLIPKVEGELSRNVSQLNHDRFLTYANMLRDFPSIDEPTRKRFYRRCISAWWKQHRFVRGKILSVATPEFLRYLRSRLVMPDINEQELSRMRDFFHQLQGVRRTAQYHDQ